MKINKKIVYMCGTDYQYETTKGGGMEDMIPIYNSIKSVKKHRKCWKECGIVKISLVLEKWLCSQKF